MNVIVGWIAGNTQSGPHYFRKKKPFGWQYSDGLVTQSYHEAEVARLRAELNAATKAGLDAIATICEKEREEDALRVDAERYRWLRDRAPDEWGVWRWIDSNSQLHVDDSSMDRDIDAAMGEGK